MDSPLIDDLISQFPLDDLFDELPDTAGPFLGDAAAASSPDSLSSWIDEIESFLMEDDAGDAAVESNTELSDSLLAELIAQSPENASGEVVDGSSDRDSDASADGGGQLQKEKVESEAGEEEDADDDPASKKRRRQLRNKDAAVRSRERKKMHVKDLEMKSKYLEGECRRMGRLLQCLVAENQALRLGLQNGSACGAIGTKQESAVLLLESLLLGSLLWFLGVMCLFTLPESPRLRVSLVNAGRRDLQTCAPRGPRNEESRHLLPASFVMSRRCKASRSKMKPGIHVPRVLAC
ncbi:bZIP transcription factor 60-like [Punica granatum]|uniref:Uncharacterized protein n=2 Tax=Punica granatum TaxID=22663 RepID=A0A2I0KT74_PUNGR|nr:bZIP transcription factor 60-like [Punica granatum]PKI71679.1 hypothetical protein CRG98_007901 [Punica granatum]